MGCEYFLFFIFTDSICKVLDLLWPNLDQMFPQMVSLMHKLAYNHLFLMTATLTNTNFHAGKTPESRH